MKRRNSHIILFALMPLLALLLGCAASPPGTAVDSPDEQLSKSRDGPIQWLHDDWIAALVKAREENKPLVVDVWAPWCHTCLSMKHYVLSDPSMASFADRSRAIVVLQGQAMSTGAVFPCVFDNVPETAQDSFWSPRRAINAATWKS